MLPKFRKFQFVLKSDVFDKRIIEYTKESLECSNCTVLKVILNSYRETTIAIVQNLNPKQNSK